MEAEHYTRKVEAKPVWWQLIPDLGRTASAMTPLPVTAESQSPGGDSPRLEYRMHLISEGEVRVRAYVSPNLNYHDTEGLRHAVSFDDQEPEIVNIHRDSSDDSWRRWVRDNVNITSSTHSVEGPGEHVLKYWMVDLGVVLQKLVVETGSLERTYLGPPESSFREED